MATAALTTARAAGGPGPLPNANSERHAVMNMLVAQSGLVLSELQDILSAAPHGIFEVQWVQGTAHFSRHVWRARLGGMIARRATALRGSEAAAVAVLCKLIVEIEGAIERRHLLPRWDDERHSVLVPLEQFARLGTRDAVAAVSSAVVIDCIRSMISVTNALIITDDATQRDISSWRLDATAVATAAAALGVDGVDSHPPSLSDDESDDEDAPWLDNSGGIISDDEPASPTKQPCSFCCSRAVSIAFIPCGHAVSCARCADQILRRSAACPICRSEVRKAQRLYF